MHQYDWQYNHQSNPIHNSPSVSQNDLLTRPTMRRNFPSVPRRLPSINSSSNNNNYSKMQESPSPLQQGMPFAHIGAAAAGGKREISIGGTGLGFPRNDDRIDPHTTQNSPQKRHHPKSQASWHSEGAEKEMNPEPLPFLPSEFKSPLERVCVNGVPLPGIHIPKDIADSVMNPTLKNPKSDSPKLSPKTRQRSSTVIKKMPIHQRHSDLWSGEALNGPKPKGYAFHTERYGFEDIRKTPEMLASGHNMETNLDFLNRMRPHRKARQREPLNLVMGGQQVALFERDDIQDELRKLKSIVLPKKAKDLYVGRGFKIPEFHAVNKPRPARFKVNGANDPDDDAVSISAPASAMIGSGKSLLSVNRQKTTHTSNFKKSKTTLDKPRKNRLLFLSSDKANQDKKNAKPLSPLKSSQTSLIPRTSPTKSVSDTKKDEIQKKAKLEIQKPPTVDVQKSTVPEPPKLDTEHDNDESNVKTDLTSGSLARKSEVVPDYYSARDPNVKMDGGWSKTELQSDGEPESDKDDNKSEDIELQSLQPKKTPTPEPSSTAVIIPREPTFEMGTDPPPRSATTKTATTPNPLKGGPVENFIESSEFDKLKKTFKRLDTDMDGHLQFLQLKSQLPKGISHSQERFIKLIYDITSSSTFFGLNEYISMSIMCQRIASIQGAAKEAFQKLNFATIEQTVKFYTDLFQSVDRNNNGKITQDSLKQILNTALEEKLPDLQFKEVVQNMQVTGDINKMDFLAYIPYFLTLESLYIHS